MKLYIFFDTICCNLDMKLYNLLYTTNESLLYREGFCENYILKIFVYALLKIYRKFNMYFFYKRFSFFCDFCIQVNDSV